MARFRGNTARTDEKQEVTPAVVHREVTLPRPSMMLGELLVSRDRVSQGQLAEALLQQSDSGKRIGALLVEIGALSEKDLAEALAHQFGLEVADLRRNRPDADTVKLLPESAARSLGAIPLRMENDVLVIAVADVSEDTLKELTEAARRRIQLAVAPESDIRQAIDTSYRALSGIDQHLKAFSASASETLRRAGAAAAEQGVT